MPYSLPPGPLCVCVCVCVCFFVFKKLLVHQFKTAWLSPLGHTVRTLCNVCLTFASASAGPCLWHTGTAHRGWSHLGQHLVQPLEGAIEMQLDPTGGAGYCLTPVKSRRRHKDKRPNLPLTLLCPAVAKSGIECGMSWTFIYQNISPNPRNVYRYNDRMTGDNYSLVKEEVECWIWTLFQVIYSK